MRNERNASQHCVRWTSSKIVFRSETYLTAPRCVLVENRRENDTNLKDTNGKCMEYEQ